MKRVALKHNCPVCGKDNDVGFRDAYVYDNGQLVFKMFCNECNYYFMELFNFSYVNTYTVEEWEKIVNQNTKTLQRIKETD